MNHTVGHTANDCAGSAPCSCDFGYRSQQEVNKTDERMPSKDDPPGKTQNSASSLLLFCH